MAQRSPFATRGEAVSEPSWNFIEFFIDSTSIEPSEFVTLTGTAMIGLGYWYNYGPRTNTEPMEAAKPAHDHARFPHLCPRCGAAAYVGLHAVDHEYPTECK